MKKVYYLFIAILCFSCATKKDITKSSLTEIVRIEDGWYKGYQNCAYRAKLPTSNAEGIFVWVKIENQNVTYIGRNKSDSRNLASSNFLVNNNHLSIPKTYSKIQGGKNKFSVDYERTPKAGEGMNFGNESGISLKCKVSLYE